MMSVPIDRIKAAAGDEAVFTTSFVVFGTHANGCSIDSLAGSQNMAALTMPKSSARPRGPRAEAEAESCHICSRLGRAIPLHGRCAARGP